MTVHGIRSGKVGPGTRSPTHGLVVSKLTVTKKHVIHRRLASSAALERLEQRGDKTLTRLYVPSYYGRGLVCRQRKIRR